ncbi:hypothetical protein REPUB_Repub12eG0014600 [Reevesia pubescens]
MRFYPPNRDSDSNDLGILNECILLVVESIKWDLKVLCLTASMNHKLGAIAKRLLWQKLFLYRAPRMVAALANSAPNERIGGGWDALAKLMFFCYGCESTQYFKQSCSSLGHFVKVSRFSKTLGRSFLTKKCRGNFFPSSEGKRKVVGENNLT